MKRRTKRQLKIDPAYIALVLSCGYDFFRELPGGIEGNFDALREVWKDPAIKAATLARCDKSKRETAWAAKVFDLGMDPHEATYMEVQK
jgi:hypothetical protein